MKQNCVHETTRNVMMNSFLPVLKDRAEAITTLEGLVHERRGYAGISIDTREHEIQAGSIRFSTTTFIHMNPPMHIRFSGLCMLLCGSAQRTESEPSSSLNTRCQSDMSIPCLTIDRTVFIEHRYEKSLRSDPSREPTEAPTYTLLPPHDPLP